jgi:hypothetical protein
MGLIGMSTYDSDNLPRAYWCGPNDGGIKRGDSAETGDEEAAPTEGAEPDDQTDLLAQADLDDLTVLDAEDPTLGLTDIGGVPADDWAANTGPTHSAEEKDRLSGRKPRSAIS